MTMGFSRDDAGKFLPAYLKQGIYEHDPFRSIDQKGVGLLVEMAVEKGRAVRPDIDSACAANTAATRPRSASSTARRAGLRELLAVPRADRAAGGGAGGVPYDSADYLRDEEDIAAYLQAVMAESAGDPAVLVRAQAVAGRARFRLQHESEQ
jgi:hypothetical protein